MGLFAIKTKEKRKTQTVVEVRSKSQAETKNLELVNYYLITAHKIITDEIICCCAAKTRQNPLDEVQFNSNQFFLI